MKVIIRQAFLLGCGLFVLTGCQEKATPGGAGFQRPPTPVESARVTVQKVIDHFTTVGTLEAADAIRVTGEIDGIITALPFREGGAVGRGALIAQLDDAQLKAEVQRAGALHQQTLATYERVRSIVDQGAGAPQDLDDALAALKVAEANLALAQTRLDKTRITAPFPGLTGKREVSPGAFVRAGSPLTTLTRIDQLRLTFSVPERLLRALKVGAEVSVTTTAYPDEILVGTIDVIEPQLDPLTRNVGVVALVGNPGELLRPGMSATVDVVLNERDAAMTVPSQSVFVESGQALVYVVLPDSTVARTAVELGTRLAAAVEVLSGLEPDQEVVLAGHQKLYQGAKVAPVGGTGVEGGASR